MMMKSIGVWWSSPTSLLHTIIKLTIPSSLLIALLFLTLGPFDSIDTVGKPPYTSHSLLHRHLRTPQKNPAAAKDGSHTSSKHENSDADMGLILASLGIHPSTAKTHSPFGAKITNWNQHRQSLLARNANAASAHGVRHYADGRPRPKVLLVTGSSPRPCLNPLGDHLLLQFIKNKIDYCRLHGIDIFYNMALLNTVMTDCWSKLPLLRKLMLSHPEMEWIWWMDSDAAFTDMTFELPLEKYEQYNFVVHGWEEQIYVKKSWVGLNAGIFLIRNCQWSLDFMDAWALFGENPKVKDELGRFFSNYLTNRPVFEGDDQAALVYILNTQKKRWGNKVFLENSYFLHGYWEIIVERYEELMQSSHAGYGDERWPYVTHFVGCKPCGKQALEGRCMKQMERALNFADNQVLQHYGFQHTHLGTFNVVEVATNETETDPKLGW